jgi:hypothetical protein
MSIITTTHEPAPHATRLFRSSKWMGSASGNDGTVATTSVGSALPFPLLVVPTSCQVWQTRQAQLYPPHRGRYNTAPSQSIARDEGFCLAQCLTCCVLPSVQRPAPESPNVLLAVSTCTTVGSAAHPQLTPTEKSRRFQCSETCTTIREHQYSTAVDAESRLGCPTCPPLPSPWKVPTITLPLPRTDTGIRIRLLLTETHSRSSARMDGSIGQSTVHAEKWPTTSLMLRQSHSRQ